MSAQSEQALTFDVAAKKATSSSTKPPSSSEAVGAVADAPLYTPPTFTRLVNTTCVSRPSDRPEIGTSESALAALPAPLQPLSTLATKLAKQPSHVIIFGWMDAPLRLVAKYAQPYTVLFPHATVLIKLSDGKSYLANETVRRDHLKTIIDEITTSPSSSVSSSLSSPTPAETQSLKAELGDSTVTLIEAEDAKAVPASASASASAASPSPSPSGVVVHSFSDGGAGNLSMFLEEMASLRAANPTRTLPAIHSLIMDSSPGKSNPSTGATAFTMHLANRPTYRAVVRFVIWITLWTLKILTAVRGDLPRAEKMRKRLNSLHSWQWITANAKTASETASADPIAVYPPRMYMYTKSDKLIPWKAVEEHARDFANIRQPGQPPRLVEMEDPEQRDQVRIPDQVAGSPRPMSVELRRWDSPPHCSIGRSDFEGYWSAVVEFYMGVLA
ncbi:hypothetical protein BCV70DRAFT_218837 [Testicularia cyperi]|uniref:DUF829-domain-containing protein n=1 Tax=Testicularia cyperi TaxID=1882483 RepID=A0A317XJF0_9BASI|nr:hypothetical protein BCV70DRAFT_218837 [Testicularia cyperi]